MMIWELQWKVTEIRWSFSEKLLIIYLIISIPLKFVRRAGSLQLSAQKVKSAHQVQILTESVWFTSH